VINHIRNQIKKRRAEKRLTQSDVALDLGITPGAYNKIESGPTAITVEKLGEIADILEVDITYFFPEKGISNKAEEINVRFSFATKTEVEELSRTINKMKQEIATLKASLPNTTPANTKKKI
jgi:transcriptional regulator with XRE-family HTH domain